MNLDAWHARAAGHDGQRHPLKQRGKSTSAFRASASKAPKRPVAAASFCGTASRDPLLAAGTEDVMSVFHGDFVSAACGAGRYRMSARRVCGLGALGRNRRQSGRAADLLHRVSPASKVVPHFRPELSGACVPQYLAGLRSESIRNRDVKVLRRFRIYERLKRPRILQFATRIEF
jgi:hypothetical protein